MDVAAKSFPDRSYGHVRPKEATPIWECHKSDERFNSFRVFWNKYKIVQKLTQGLNMVTAGLRLLIENSDYLQNKPQTAINVGHPHFQQ